MLADIVEVAFDAAETLSESMMNSGNTPAAGPSTVGTPSSAPSMPSDSSPSRDTDPGRERDTNRAGEDETPHHDDPNYERDLHLSNAGETAVNAASEVAQSWLGFNNLGKVLGPLISVVGATPAVTDGVPLVAGYDGDKWDTISEQSGDAFGDGSSRSDGDVRSDPDASNDESTRRRQVEHTEESQAVLDDIEAKLQMEREAARRRHERFGGSF